MFPSYSDITSRIDEDPKWYTVEGYPRYDDFKPGECNIYARYALLVLIGCQDCEATMHIGQDYSAYDCNEFRVDVDKLPDDVRGAAKENDVEIWRNIKHSIFIPRMTDINNKVMYRTLGLQDFIDDWSFGDPPEHGCPGAGETMGCVPIQVRQVWDRQFGQEVTGGVITKFGIEARIIEMEGYVLLEDWAKQLPQYEDFYDKLDFGDVVEA